MKRPYLLFLSLALVIAGMFVSCSKDDDKPDNTTLLHGRWQYEYGLDSLFNAQGEVLSADTIDMNGQDNIYIDFQENGQFSTNLSNDTTITGTYRLVDASTLELKMNGSSGQVPVKTLSARQLVFVMTDTDYGNGNYSKEYYHFRK